MTNLAQPPGRRIFWLMATGIVLIATALVLMRGNTSAPTNAGSLASSVSDNAASTGLHPTIASSSVVGPFPQTFPFAPGPTAARGAGSQGTDDAHHVPAVESERPPATSTAPITTETPPARPAVLHLPTLHVTADVAPVDSTNGVLQVPDDVSTVGWWRHSVLPGSGVGSTVLDGHIDSAAAGEGALFHLADLSPGDPLAVTTTTGFTIHYEVQARRVYVKEQGLPADLFNQQGPERLVIISCGGSFDSTVRSYRDNIAVFATPITATAGK